MIIILHRTHAYRKILSLTNRYLVVNELEQMFVLIPIATAVLLVHLVVMNDYHTET